MQASFDLEEVLTTERDAQVALAQSIGIPPTTPIQVTDVTAVPLPTTFEASVEQIISRALEQRPDLSAKVATLRAREANVRRVQKEYGPRACPWRLMLVGYSSASVSITAGAKPNMPTRLRRTMAHASR